METNQTIKKGPIDYITGKFERTSYGIYFFGQLIFYGIVTGFLSLYLTDSGVPAIAVSGIYAVAKIWDAVNDPLFGVIVDRTNMKRGKYIPWVRLSSFLIPLTTIFMFAMPSGMSVQIKTIWAAAAYVLWDAAYTMCDIPIFALATSMTDRLDERDRLYLICRLFTFIGTLAVLVAVPMLYPTIGWTTTVIILSIAGFLTMLPVGFSAKERFYSQQTQQENPSLKSLVKYLFSNKYLLIFNGAVIVNALTNTSSAVSTYVAIYCLGNAQWITILSLIASVPTLLSVLLTPLLLKKIDKLAAFTGSLGLSIALGLITYFVGYQRLGIFIALGILKAVCTGIMGVTLVMFTADCAEYGHFVTGNRAQGIAFSIQTFTAKLTGGLSSTVGMFILGLIGFVSGEGAAQTPETIAWIWRLSALFPAISGTAAFLIILFAYNLKTADVDLMVKANTGEISREEAIAGFSHPYVKE